MQDKFWEVNKKSKNKDFRIVGGQKDLRQQIKDKGYTDEQIVKVFSRGNKHAKVLIKYHDNFIEKGFNSTDLIDILYSSKSGDTFKNLNDNLSLFLEKFEFTQNEILPWTACIVGNENISFIKENYPALLECKFPKKEILQILPQARGAINLKYILNHFSALVERGQTIESLVEMAAKFNCVKKLEQLLSANTSSVERDNPSKKSKKPTQLSILSHLSSWKVKVSEVKKNTPAKPQLISNPTDEKEAVKINNRDNEAGNNRVKESGELKSSASEIPASIGKSSIQKSQEQLSLPPFKSLAMHIENSPREIQAESPLSVFKAWDKQLGRSEDTYTPIAKEGEQRFFQTTTNEPPRDNSLLGAYHENLKRKIYQKMPFTPLEILDPSPLSKKPRIDALEPESHICEPRSTT